MSRAIISIILIFGLFWQQTGFAQMAAGVNIAGPLAGTGSTIVQEKFRPVHLRYFSYDSLGDNFKVLVDKGDLEQLDNAHLQEQARTLLSYFLIGVTLPDDAFWVNLRPDSQDQIIDRNLEKTDVGRIMLEADLQLKKDIALFTSPNTAEGKEYWNRLYDKAAEIFGNEDIEIPALTRPWITPGEIIVRESEDGAYVYKAVLKVMLEQDYLKDSPAYDFKDERFKVLNEYSSRLIKKLIIPKLTREVNSSKRYAALRQVYYSLILSRWFKSRFSGNPGAYASLINTRDLTNLTSQKSWSKTYYFDRYRSSFAEGEYNIQESVYTPTGQIIRSYFSGGINVADGAIDTRNGIFSPEDNAAAFGMIIEGKAMRNPQDVNLLFADGGNLLSGVEEGIRKYKVAEQLAGLWVDFPEKGELFGPLFEKVGAANAYSEYKKSIKRAREKFIIQYFPYPPNFDAVKTPPPLEGLTIQEGDRQFTRAFKRGVIGRLWEHYLSPVHIAGISVTPIDAPKPYGPEHVILAVKMFENLPQLLTEDAIKVALNLVDGSEYGEHLKIGFNSAGAWASQDQLHLQIIFYEGKEGTPSPLPVEDTDSFKTELLIARDGIAISELRGYPARAFVFEGTDIEKLTGSLLAAVKVLQEEKTTVSGIGKRFEGFPEFYEKKSDGKYLIKGLPHNLTFTKKADGTLRAYLFPRKLQNEEAKPYGIGAAFVELSGTLLAWDDALFKKIQEVGVDKAAAEVLEGIQIEPKDFEMLQTKLIQALKDGGVEDSTITFEEINQACKIKMDETEQHFMGVPGKEDVFRYTLGGVVRENAGRLVKMLNIGRGGKPPSTVVKRNMKLPFGTGRNYLDIRPKVLIKGDVNIGGVSTDVTINPFPFFLGHILLIPERLKGEHNQVFIEKAAIVALAHLQNMNRSSYKVAFNSMDAFGSFNHLHLQAFDYSDKDGNPSSLPVERETPEPIKDKDNEPFVRNSVALSTLPGWMVNTLVLTSNDSGALQEEMLKLTDILYALEQPFNILFTYRPDSGEYKIYVFPRQPETASRFGTGVAYLELSGEVLFINRDFDGVQDPARSREIYTNAQEDDLKKEIAAVGIDRKSFDTIIGMFQGTVVASTPELTGTDNPNQDGGDEDAVSKPVTTGGIDFRTLHMKIQPRGDFSRLNLKLPARNPAELERINTASEIRQINDLVRSGIAPSGERIKGLVVSCVQKGQIKTYADMLLRCLADIFKMEEMNAGESSPELREALLIVESQS